MHNFSLSSVIAYMWAIILFYKHFDIKYIIEKEKKEQIVKGHSQEIWMKTYVTQNYGKSFYILIGAAAIHVVVLLLSIGEYWLNAIVVHSRRDDEALLINPDENED